MGNVQIYVVNRPAFSIKYFEVLYFYRLPLGVVVRSYRDHARQISGMTVMLRRVRA